MKRWVIATIALLAIGGGASAGGCGGDGEPVDEGATATPVKDFSMLLATGDDFREAAQRIATFMPDFDCTGGWDNAQRTGTLECHAGSSGFSCTLKAAWEAPGTSRSAQVVCEEGTQPAEGLPGCIARPAAPAYIVRCSGPNTDAGCDLRLPSGQGAEQPFQLTCERA
jgi:hypothetical protein